MNYFSRYRRPFLLGLILGVVVIVLVLIIADYRAVVEVFSKFDLALLPVILILAPLNYLFRYIKWNYYLKIADLEPEPRMNRYIFMSGLSMTITPGKVGELMKCYLLKEHMGAPVSKTSSIVMAERVTDALSMVVLATLGFLAYPYGKVVVPISASLLFAVILLFHSDRLMKGIILRLARISWLEKSLLFIREFQRSAKMLFSIRSLLFAVGIGVVSWGFEGFVVYFAIKALGGEISILGSFFVVAFSSLLGALSFLPGGLGIAEGSIIAIMVLTGIGKEMAAATTVITRFSTLWLGVGVGIVGLVLTQREFSRRDKGFSAR